MGLSVQINRLFCPYLLNYMAIKRPIESENLLGRLINLFPRHNYLLSGKRGLRVKPSNFEMDNQMCGLRANPKTVKIANFIA
jgi:hypothetical protein